MAPSSLETAGLVTPALLLAFDLSFLGDVWSFVQENSDELLAGLRRTLQVSAIAIAGAFVVGLILGAARAHRIPVVSQLAAVYVEVIRNTPILVQIFMLYFALPQVGIRLDAFTVAWLAVTIWGGAFNTENFRAGFEAVPVRYREAGAALGFRGIATFLNITLPIGGRIALPSSINTYISVVKNTSLMYVISYPELTTVALQINALTLETVETFSVLAVTYLAIVWTMSALIRLLESHLALPEERR
jgi:polar amino acid transport system permease protein